jgi:hypothetical protein
VCGDGFGAKPPPKSIRNNALPEKEEGKKTKKIKLVRDSFTIPKAEFEVIEVLKTRCIAFGQPMKKSELLRAGIKLLATLDDAGLQAALAQVPSLKTGRPAKDVPETVTVVVEAPAPMPPAAPVPSAKTQKPARPPRRPAAKKTGAAAASTSSAQATLDASETPVV